MAGLNERAGGAERPVELFGHHPDSLSWDHLRRGYELFRYAVEAFNDPLVDDLVHFARDWRPDLVVWDPLTFAGAVAARACGAADARLLMGLDVWAPMRQRYLKLLQEQPPSERVDPVGDWLAQTRGRFGLAFDEQAVTGRWTIDQLPADLRSSATPGLVPMRYVPINGNTLVPAWLSEPPARCWHHATSTRHCGPHGWPSSARRSPSASTTSPEPRSATPSAEYWMTGPSATLLDGYSSRCWPNPVRPRWPPRSRGGQQVSDLAIPMTTGHSPDADIVRAMVRIRRIEEVLADCYRQEQQMRTPVHFSIGQEATPVGMCAAIEPDDVVYAGHRSHAPYLAKGGDLPAMVAELHGKEAGCARGRGGSVHLIDTAVSFAGSAAILGEMISVATPR